MNRLNLFGAAALIALAASAANAGYTVTTGADPVVNIDTGAPGGSIGDSFTIGGLLSTADTQPGGAFATYLADTPADPQLTGGDLNFFRYNLTGTITGVAGNVVTYSGNYLIFYDQNQDGEPNEGLTVSGGNLDATATFITGETATFLGSLAQTQGPSNPAFADLSYGGNPVILTGTYADGVIDGLPSQTGFLTSTLRQNAQVPEPALFVQLAAGLFGILVVGRRR